MQPGDLKEVEIAPEFLKLLYYEQRSKLAENMETRETFLNQLTR
jgi:hypothetical protein